MKNLIKLLRDNAQVERKPLALVRNDAGTEATLYIYDTIDPYWGVNAQDVAKQIAGLDSAITLNLRINSPGGDVFEARAISSQLKQFGGKVVAYIDGLAASAATTIAMAADEVVISQGSFFMIHNAWSVVIGNKADMTEMASLLDKVDGAIVGDYATKTGKPLDEIAAWMAAETWFTAQESVDNGFADRIAGGDAGAPASNKWNLAAYDKTPKALIDPSPAPQASEPDWSAIHANNQRRLRLLNLA